MFPRKLSPEQEQVVCGAYSAGGSAAEIAADMNVSESTIRGVLKRNNIAARRTLSASGRERIANSTRKQWQEGKRPPMLGKRLSPEHRKKALANLTQSASGEANPRWTGGRKLVPARNGQGYYVYIYAPDHPAARAKKNSKYVAEHRLVMEHHLGRYLTSLENVHHRNGIKDDNRIENLELVTHANHVGEVVCPHCGQIIRIK